MRSPRFHGRFDDSPHSCAVPGCGEPGEFRAPLTPGTFDGPGRYQYYCLDHVRAHNAAYNFFAGMSPDEIEEAQSPLAGWDRNIRAFAYSSGSDPGPAWGDFKDPLDAIAARFRPGPGRAPSERFSPRERDALRVLGLDEAADRTALRKRYSALVREYHPDRNGGDRSHEDKLARVIDAYNLLKGSRAFA
jgi:hypothetical protein